MLVTLAAERVKIQLDLMLPAIYFYLELSLILTTESLLC